MMYMEPFEADSWATGWHGVNLKDEQLANDSLEIAARFIQVPEEIFQRWLDKRAEVAKIEEEFLAIWNDARPEREQARQELAKIREAEAELRKAKQDACTHSWVIDARRGDVVCCSECGFEDWYGLFELDSFSVNYLGEERKPNTYDAEELPRWNHEEWRDYLKKESK